MGGAPAMKHLLLMLAACAPNNQIGQTSVEVMAAQMKDGIAGVTGHLARSTGTTVELRLPTGALAWSESCRGSCPELVMDDQGNVYGVSSSAGTEIFKRNVDGALAWMRVAGDTTHFTLDATGNVWVSVTSAQPIDLGGGAIGGGDTPFLWARYAPDGTHLASGTMEVFLIGPRALPGGGIVGVDSSSRHIVAVDDLGRTQWRIDERVDEVAVHADGEITAVTNIKDPISFVRFDADRNVRWRRSSSGELDLDAHVKLSPLPDGSIVFAGGDSLAGSIETDARFLEHIDRDSHPTREVLDSPVVQLYPSVGLDGFWFFATDFIDADGVLIRRRL